MFNKKFDENNQDPLQPSSVNTAGPEGLSIAPTSETTRAPESHEHMDSAEQRAEGERKKEQLTEKAGEQKPPQPQQQVQQPTQTKPAVEPPKVYGYKIPPQLATNYKQIKNNAGKGDPTKGLTCLYIFLDRLLKMHSR